MDMYNRTDVSKVTDPRQFLLMPDVIRDSPTSPPSICLFGCVESDNRDQIEHWQPGYYDRSELCYSVLVSEVDIEKFKVLGPQDFRSMHEAFGAEDHKHYPSEEGESRTIEYENIVHDMFWDDGQGTSLVVPAQRMTNYLGLRQVDSDLEQRTRWQKPDSATDIIVRNDEHYAQGNRTLIIAYDELRDYLAAREKHLLIYRWAERHVIFSYDTDLPWIDGSTREVDGGQLVLSAPWDNHRKSGLIIRSELDQYFVIPPARSPSHWRLNRRKEVQYFAEFKDENGDIAEGVCSPNNVRIISLNRSVLDLFNKASRPGWEAEETDPGRIYLGMPNHDGLWCSNSEHGQIQVLLRDLGKLSRENQEALAPFSETKRGDPTPEWHDCFFMCIPPTKDSWHKQIYDRQLELHNLIGNLVTGQNPIVSPPSENLRRVLIRPHGDDEEAFFRIALKLQKALFSEGGKRTQWFDPSVCPEFKDECGSISSLKGLARCVSTETQSKVVSIGLTAVNIFRQVEAHPATAASALKKAGYEGTNYAEHYTKLMSDVVAALDVCIEIARGLQPDPVQVETDSMKQ